MTDWGQLARLLVQAVIGWALGISFVWLVVLALVFLFGHS